jgi:hypothetical protein
MTLDAEMTARHAASTFPSPAPRILFFMRPILDIIRMGRVPLFFFCTLAFWAGSFSGLGNFGGGAKLAGNTPPPFGVGTEYLLRTFTFWIDWNFLVGFCLILVDISRGCQHETCRGTVKPHELR